LQNDVTEILGLSSVQTLQKTVKMLPLYQMTMLKRSAF